MNRDTCFEQQWPLCLLQIGNRGYAEKFGKASLSLFKQTYALLIFYLF